LESDAGQGAFACQTLIYASFQYKFQYASALFKWGPEELGYWLSLVTSSRALFLTLVLPLILKYVSTRKGTIKLPLKRDEPLHDRDATAPAEPAQESHSTSVPSPSAAPAEQDAADKPLHKIPVFDLYIARVSLFLEAICYSVLPLAMQPALFTGISMFTALAGGFNPAAQALALNLYTQRGESEIGKLYGAISVLQAVSSQIIGPTIYGVVFMNTAGTYPRTIFFVSAGAMVVGFTLLCFVRLPNNTTLPPGEALDVENNAQTGVEREDTLVNITDVDGESAAVPEGRKKASDPS